MDKTRILREIRRLGAANGGTAPGRGVFERETGIKQAEWYPHIWLRWGDALAEAGYVPHQLTAKVSDDVVIQRFIALVRELHKFPVKGEIVRKAKADKSFGNHGQFDRFGGKEKLIEAVVAWCESKAGFEDIVALSAQRAGSSTGSTNRTTALRVLTGFVYLMKSGRHYKIGRTNSMGRRSNELAIKIPVPPTTVHSIETDDPAGVEAYWHRRFSDKRGEGEWFDLTSEDVRAFKRWKHIA